MKLKKFNCCICGKEEDPNKWDKDCGETLVKVQMCFTCNHWRQQYQADLEERGKYNWAVVNGHHYTLAPHRDMGPKGFSGRMVTVRFKDGTVKQCDNLWHQGEISNPYWRKLMPDNAEIDW